MLTRLKRIFQQLGIRGLVRAIDLRLRSLLAGRAKAFRRCAPLFQGKTGLEIGGPSPAFGRRGFFPLYPVVAHLDNCNFSHGTVWEGHIEEGNTFRFDPAKPTGRQYVAEATDLERLPSNAYDFVLASHVLEHTANPIRALSEWLRLLKNRGVLVLILPDRKRTFDYRRPVTTLEHLLDDLEAAMTEDDLTHLPEILALHDLARDPEAGDRAAFEARSRRNAENRCLHHHVFDAQLAVSLLRNLDMQVLAAEEVQPFHILVVAQKVGRDSWPPGSPNLRPA
ncbi:MAG: methyltransferase domain-containing protein [Rhodocyclaceae bacterium]|nr:methyltransferase domain-containing protein [Rhodocyclaceae bacterium]